MDQRRTTPIALTIAGSDSSGGAGIQADLKTFAAFGVYGASVVTALTAQNTLGVTAIHDVPAKFIAEQIDSVLDDLDVGAVKTGMLATTGAIGAVAAGLERHRVRALVVDPVMVATSGDALLEPDAVAALRERIVPLAALLTPNRPEAALLLGEDEVGDDAGLRRQAERLLALGSGAVLLKGGHGRGDTAVDIFFDGRAMATFSAPRIATPHTHGTGCTLSAAITAGLAAGADLESAIDRAKIFVTAAIRAGAGGRIGRGRGPLDHIAAGDVLRARKSVGE